MGIGRDSDQAIIGDWDGDGTDDLGLLRYNRLYFDIDNDGSADETFTLNYF